MNQLALAIEKYYEDRGYFLYTDDEGETQVGNTNEVENQIKMAEFIKNPSGRSGKVVKFNRLLG